MTCPNCGTQNEPGAAFCEYCGAALPAPDPRPRGVRAWFIGVVTVMLVIAAGVTLGLVLLRNGITLRPPSATPHATGAAVTPVKQESSQPDGPATPTTGEATTPQTGSAPPSSSISTPGLPSAGPTDSPGLPGGTATTASLPQLPPGIRACNADVGAGSNTSCPFAQNVAAAVWAAGPANPLQVHAHSPATGRDYVMSCIRGPWIVCKGGTNAVVYVKPV